VPSITRVTDSPGLKLYPMICWVDPTVTELFAGTADAVWTRTDAGIDWAPASSTAMMDKLVRSANGG